MHFVAHGAGVGAGAWVRRPQSRVRKLFGKILADGKGLPDRKRAVLEDLAHALLGEWRRRLVAESG
jgi:hypothetical protein